MFSNYRTSKSGNLRESLQPATAAKPEDASNTKSYFLTIDGVNISIPWSVEKLEEPNAEVLTLIAAYEGNGWRTNTNTPSERYFNQCINHILKGIHSKEANSHVRSVIAQRYRLVQKAGWYAGRIRDYSYIGFKPKALPKDRKEKFQGFVPDALCPLGRYLVVMGLFDAELRLFELEDGGFKEPWCIVAGTIGVMFQREDIAGLVRHLVKAREGEDGREANETRRREFCAQQGKGFPN